MEDELDHVSDPDRGETEALLVEKYLSARNRGEADTLIAWVEKHKKVSRDRLRDLQLDAMLFELGSAFASEDERPQSEIPSLPNLEIREQLGRGGMGVVYKAWQESLKRYVAVKFIRNDRLTTHADKERFREEARKAASVAHRHLVPIYDFGEHHGQYFFTMELVPAGRLSDPEQLQRYQHDQRAAASLMVKLADAVQHAHAHAIIHRDLKPSNVLFAEDGEPRVADFGLARRLIDEPSAFIAGDSAIDARGKAETAWNQSSPLQSSPGDLHTRTGAIVGTPNYMAPEQAFGWDADQTVRVDVYGLGAILFEILTGRPPRMGKHSWEMLMQMSMAPASPRQLNPLVNRDLDAICTKCLQAEPSKRYNSAEALAFDLLRWLESKPVQARPVSTGERLSKWASRRPELAITLSLLVILTVAGISGIAWKWREAVQNGREALSAQALAEEAGRREKERAAEAEQAREAESKYVELLHQFSRNQIHALLDQIEDLPGSTPARELLIQSVLANLKTIANKMDDRPDIRRTLAVAYGRLGDLYGRPREASTGNPEAAFANYNESRRHFEALADDFPENPLAQRDMATILSKLGNWSLDRNQFKEAFAFGDKAKTIRKTLVDRNPKDSNYQAELAHSHDSLGNILRAKGDNAGALHHYRTSLQLRESVAFSEPNSAEAKCNVSISQNLVGEIQLRLGDFEAAIESFRQAFEIRQALVKRVPNNFRYSRFLIGSRDRMGDLLGQNGRLDEALAICTPGVSEARKNALDSRNVLAQLDLAEILLREGELLQLKKETPKSLTSVQEAVALLEKTEIEQPGAVNPLKLVRGYERLGDVLLQLNKSSEAEGVYLKAVSRVEKWSEKNPSNVEGRTAWAVVSRKLGKQLIRRGEHETAENAIRKSVELLAAVVSASPENVPARIDQATSLIDLAALIVKRSPLNKSSLDRWRAALARYLEARQILTTLKEKQNLRQPHFQLLSDAEDGARRCEEAINKLKQSLSPNSESKKGRQWRTGIAESGPALHEHPAHITPQIRHSYT